MKIAVTGSNGQIGSRLVRLGAEPLSCDVTSKEQVEEQLHRVKPDVILHLAAMTSVDWCQEHYQEACSINVYGANTVCEVAEKVIGAGRVALVSSDMVFDGKHGRYSEYDEPNPINNYGLTKMAAEGIASLYGDKVVRISRCFDSKSKDISEYIERLKEGKPIFVPTFMIRSYCHLDMMAVSLYRYASLFDEMPEILHVAGADSVSFFALMRYIAILYKYDEELVKTRREDMPLYYPRPYKTGLDTSLADSLGIPIYHIGTSVGRLEHENA